MEATNYSEDLLDLIDSINFSVSKKDKTIFIIKQNNVFPISLKELTNIIYKKYNLAPSFKESWTKKIHHIVNTYNDEFEESLYYQKKNQELSIFQLKYRESTINDDEILFCLLELSSVKKVNSVTDSLTGCYQKNVIERLCYNEIAEKKDEFFMAILDIDNFKKFNDTYGHLCGDTVLKNTCNKIREFLGPSDYFGRIGGDEFLLLIHCSNEYQSVWDICHDISNSFNQSIVSSGELQVTITLGVALFPKDGQNYEEIFNKCDRALYRGKLKGRKCFVIYNETNCGGIENTYINSQQTKQDSFEVITKFLHVLSSKTKDEKATSECLAYLGKEYQVDRIFILKTDIKNEKAEVYSSWTNKKIDSSMVDLSYNNIKEFMKKVLYSDYFCKSLINPGKYEFEQMCTKQNIHSCASFLLKDSNNNAIGLFRIDICNTHKLWQDEEITTLRIISKILSVLIQPNESNEIKK